MGYISLTGNPITFTTNRENTISSLVLNGKTTQSGTGDPSPTNIRPISGISASISVNGTVYAPSVPIKLYGQNEVYDIWEPCVMVDGVLRSRLTQRLRNLVLDGTESVTMSTTAVPGVNRFNIPVPRIFVSTANVLCNAYKTVTANDIQSFGVDNSVSCYVTTIWSIDKRFNTPSDFKSNLAAQKSAGTPVTIVYQLATPIVTLGDPYTIPNAAGDVTISAENTIDVVYVQFETSNNKYQDIQGADSTLYTQFIQAWKTGDYATAFGIIANNPQLNTKSFVADVINTLSTNLTNLQNMNDPTFKSDRIQTSTVPPVGLQTGQVYFKTL